VDDVLVGGDNLENVLEDTDGTVVLSEQIPVD